MGYLSWHLSFSAPSLLTPPSLLYSIPAQPRGAAHGPAARSTAGVGAGAHLGERALGVQQGAARGGCLPSPAPSPADPAAAGAWEGASAPAWQSSKVVAAAPRPAAPVRTRPLRPEPAPPPIPERGAAPRPPPPPSPPARPQLRRRRGSKGRAGRERAVAAPPGSRWGRSGEKQTRIKLSARPGRWRWARRPRTERCQGGEGPGPTAHWGTSEGRPPVAASGARARPAGSCRSASSTAR